SASDRRRPRGRALAAQLRDFRSRLEGARRGARDDRAHAHVPAGAHALAEDGMKPRIAPPAEVEREPNAEAEPAPPEPEAPPEPPELRCTICGLRACWTR